MIFGVDKWKKTDIIWDKNNVINGHFLLVGTSGSGKSYTIKKIIKNLSNDINDYQFHILDVHGDLNPDGSETIRFSEIDNNGINPLKISDNPYYGGVRKKVRNFINTLNRTSRKLGTKQEIVLVNLLYDLYAANGFYPDDPKSWSIKNDTRRYKNPNYPKKHPTMKDLLNFTQGKLKQMMHGANSKAIYHLDLLKKEVQKIENTSKKINKYSHDKEMQSKETEKLEKVKEKVKEEYSKYVDSITTGREFEEVLKYDSIDVLKSVYDRVLALETSGIFKDNPPNNINRKKIYRYDIKSLNKDEQKLFVDILLEDIYEKAKERGEQKNPNTFIVIDEAHMFTTEDSEHIINVLSKEARKFGVGLMLASQSFSHFNADLIQNSNTKIILQLDEMTHSETSKKLQIDIKRLKYIIPHKTIILQIKNKGSNNNVYMDCIL